MAIKKIPRNSPCPCGSGLKYKKCCKDTSPMDALKKGLMKIREQERKRQNFVERFGHARIPLCMQWQGKWMSVVGSDIYRQTQEGPYSFINVIHDHALLKFFGQAYIEAQEKLPYEKRHPAIQWMQSFVEHSERIRATKNYDLREEQIGSGAAWFRFAYDLFTIGDNAKLEARMKERLLDHTYFQATRHELKIAALCIVAGFDVEFENEDDNSRKHTEFIARDKFSQTKIAVEVKSRHRRGVQGFEGGRDIKPGELVDIRKPLLEAYKKEPGLPFYVFIDTNLPPVEDDSTWNRWLQEVDQTMSDLESEGYADPCPANIVFFSNDPSHYLMQERIGYKRDRVWIKQYTAKSPRISHPSDNLAERFLKAHAQRLVPPAEFSDFIFDGVEI